MCSSQTLQLVMKRLVFHILPFAWFASSAMSHAAGNAASGWAISAGAEVRQMSVGFSISPPAAPNTTGLFSLRDAAGLGDVGVVSSKSQIIHYSDGSVGPDRSGLGKDRDTSFSVAFTTQVVFGTQPPGADFPTAGSVTFHSSGTSYAYERSFFSNGFSTDDDQVVVGPYIRLRRELSSSPAFTVGFATGWSYFQSRHSSGEQIVGRLVVNEIATRSNYTYLYSLASAGASAGFPPDYDNSKATGAIYDADSYNSFGGFSPGDPEFVHDPLTLRSSSSTATPLLFMEARSIASLHLQTHVIPFLFDVTWKLSPRMAAGIEAGPTLNLINHDLRSQTDWTLNGTRIARQTDSSRGTHVAVGATVRAKLAVALTSDHRWSLEASGGYDWVPSHNVRAGPAQAEIDISSFVGSLGVCFKF